MQAKPGLILQVNLMVSTYLPPQAGALLQRYKSVLSPRSAPSAQPAFQFPPTAGIYRLHLGRRCPTVAGCPLSLQRAKQR